MTLDSNPPSVNLGDEFKGFWVVQMVVNLPAVQGDLGLISRLRSLEEGMASLGIILFQKDAIANTIDWVTGKQKKFISYNL